jgi:hypothetical protein
VAVAAPEPEPEPEPEPLEAEHFSQAPHAWDTTNETEAVEDARASVWDDRFEPEPEPAVERPEAEAPASPPLDSLDDDAFFASLRDAVRDDSPLGNRSTSGFYDDDDDPEAGRKLFRRRR